MTTFARARWFLRSRVVCLIIGHDPQEIRVARGRLSDIVAGLVGETLEYRCSRCFAEFDR